MGIVQSSLQKIGTAFKPMRAGDDKLLHCRLARGRDATLEVTSVGFVQDGVIPRHFTQDSDDVSPPIQWSKVPSGTRELVVCCEDPDAPSARPFLHWLAHGIDATTTELRENVDKVARPATATMIQARNSARHRGYVGPKAAAGPRVHRYHFQVFALDVRLGLDEHADRDIITDAMRGHVLAFGDLVGSYERLHDTHH